MKLSTCTEWLFFHLWKRNPQTGQSCYGVFLADTLIYRWAQPYFRYFTAPNGQIIRKTKERVYIDNVEVTFTENETLEPVAVLLTSQQSKSMNIILSSQSQKKQQEIINFEYFEKNQFFDFLHQREKDLNAILQKFIKPKGNHNSMIKVSWSPQFCLLHRKTNLFNLTDNKKTMIEKICTFEGPEYLAEQDSISSPLLSADLEQLCVNIVKHVQEVSGGNIQIIRMVLYFKIDDDNRIWLLFCTGIKVRDKFGPAQIDELQKTRLESPQFRIVRKDKEPQNKGIDPIQNQVKVTNGFIEKLKYQHHEVCSNCDKLSKQLYMLAFSYIIDSFEKKIVKNEFTRLPEDLRKIKLNQEQKENEKEKPARNRHYRPQSKEQYELENEIDKNQKTILKSKYELKKDNQQNFDDIQMEIQELCKYLDEEQEDQKINFSSVPTLLLKVWGKLPDEKYQILQKNQTWRALKTQVCLDCFLEYTQVCDSNDLERKANLRLMQQNLKTKLKLFRRIKKILSKINYQSSKNNKSVLPILSLDNQKKQQAPQQKQIAQSTLQNSSVSYTQPINNNYIGNQKIKKRSKNRTSMIYNNIKGFNFPLSPSFTTTTTSKSSISYSRQHITLDYQLNTVSELKSQLIQLQQEEEEEKQQKERLQLQQEEEEEKQQKERLQQQKQEQEQKQQAQQQEQQEQEQQEQQQYKQQQQQQEDFKLIEEQDLKKNQQESFID